MTDVRPSSPENPCTATRHFILGTAGHIDHGKTSLVRALTGTDTDRLPEERRRGMTIELGFAELTLGQARLGIVDVPGHERFVRTMVAGATGIDLALVVVAADDSVMPQTTEHVEILHLLGVSRGVVAITKVDTVDEDMVELVAEDIRSLLAATSLSSAPIIPVSSITGAGIDNLKTALATAITSEDRSTLQPPFRMAVDRVFSVKGRGTVVTGSLVRGSVCEGDALEVWPSGAHCRVRGLQSHGTSLPTLQQGQRAAVNLSGIDRGDLERGVELATPGYLQPSRIQDIRLSCLASSQRPLKSASVVRVELGTREVYARIVLVGQGALYPGRSCFAQIRCGEALAASWGQRFIVRDENAARTIGGGVILRPVARRRRRSAGMESSLERLMDGTEVNRLEEALRFAGFSMPTALQLCCATGIEVAEIPGLLEQLKSEGRWQPIGDTNISVVSGTIDDLTDRLVAWLERHHKSHPDLPGRLADSVLGWLERMTTRSLARPLLLLLVENGTIRRLGRFVCLPAFAPSLSGADEKLMLAMIDAIRAGGFQPPAPEDVPSLADVDRKRQTRLVTLAVALGELVQIDGKIFLADDVERQLRERVADLVTREGKVTVAQIREALASSRKYAVPFLEYLDRIGYTKRVGDYRILTESENE